MKIAINLLSLKRSSIKFLQLFFVIIVLTILSCNREKPKENNQDSNRNSVQEFVETRLEIDSEGWKLIGDLLLPVSKDSISVVLMLNKANGTREAYVPLAKELIKKGIGSLRLDLRGHGESTNLGTFVPFEVPRSPIIWNSEQDVINVCKYLKMQSQFNLKDIGLVGGSYSGEEMAEAGRINGFEKAYVELSPGSFSDESIEMIDKSNASWFFISAKEDIHLIEITDLVNKNSKTVDLLILPGKEHASNLLNNNPALNELIATWLYHKL